MKENKDNVVCPIKLLLILALRLGNVNARTVDEVLQLAGQRRDRAVIWAHPRRPVLCAFSKGNGSIKSDTPAGNHQLSHTMNEAGLKAGFLARVLAHDLRAGTARDAANLRASIKGYDTQVAAAVIGHSEKARATGVTSKYVGSISEDVWTKRVEESFEDPFEIEIASQPFKRRKLTTSDVTKMCEMDGVNPSDRKNRKKMSRLHRKQDVQDWAEAGKNASAHEGVTGKWHALFTASYYPTGGSF